MPVPLPTFVIAGSQKCGTTSLAATLRQHRQVHVPRPKEVHFFDQHFARGTEWYAEQFSPREHHRQVGEATPSYLDHPLATRRLARTLPDARIVVVLRNPVDRAYSHYWHKRRLGDEPLETFEEAVAAEPGRRQAARRASWLRHAYVGRGHYIDRIEEYVASHGRDRVHVVLLDDLVAAPRPTIRALLRFLDVNPKPARTMTFGRRNSYRAGEAKDAERAAYPPMSPETRALLSEQYAASNARLAAFLDRDLSAWQPR
jgi:hypothetical protein